MELTEKVHLEIGHSDAYLIATIPTNGFAEKVNLKIGYSDAYMTARIPKHWVCRKGILENWA